MDSGQLSNKFGNYLLLDQERNRHHRWWSIQTEPWTTSLRPLPLWNVRCKSKKKRKKRRSMYAGWQSDNIYRRTKKTRTKCGDTVKYKLLWQRLLLGWESTIWKQDLSYITPYRSLWKVTIKKVAVLVRNEGRSRTQGLLIFTCFPYIGRDGEKAECILYYRGHDGR